MIRIFNNADGSCTAKSGNVEVTEQSGSWGKVIVKILIALGFAAIGCLYFNLV